MPRHEETRDLPFAANDLFDLVADVKSYPDFLPWCRNARLYRQREDGFMADLVIGFKIYKETFTSRVRLDRPRHIHVDYIRGPLRYLKNDWWFEEQVDGRTNVHFIVDFEFKNPVFQRLVGLLFEEAVSHMVSAFEERARKVLPRND